MTVKARAWDLTPLVPSTEVKELKLIMEKHVKDAEKLATKYKGKVKSLDAKGLYDFFEQTQKHFLEGEGLFAYARLKYSANSLDPDAKQVFDLAQRIGMQVRQIMAFTDIETAHLVASKPELIKDPQLVEYRHALKRFKRRAPHMLSDIEEQLIIQKDRFGNDAWYQLQNDWLSTRTFEIEIEGKKKMMPYGEIISYYEDPDRDVRQAANHIVYTALGRDEILWASALRAVLGDHLEISKRRKWPSPRTQSLIDNDVDDEAIDVLMTTVENHVKLYRRYLRLKAKLMKLPKLGNWDVIAPLPDMPERTFKWKEARKLVLEAYQSFDSDTAQIVQDMFDKDRIDGEVRKGKRSGAFYYPWYTGKSGFILLSYNGRLGEVFTLAHENGHAVQGTMIYQNQKPINSEIGMCIAETGSIFGELLLAEKLIAEAKTDKEKIEVLAKILDEFGMTVFQVSARYFFEMDLYNAFERGEYLDGETISKYWVKGRDKIYGDAVEWLPEMKWEWTMKQHYYIPRFRLYNYPYTFAQLFVFALYRLYKEQGKDFVPKFHRILSSGSTISPRELAAELDFDITTPKFWALGMKQAEEFITQLESLI